jgi:O-antigen ligase
LFALVIFGPKELHDILRYLILITSPVFILYNLNLRPSTDVIRLHAVPIFFAIIVSNFIYVIVLGNARDSIFTGSENVALIIFTLIYLVVLGQRNSIFMLISSSLGFVFFLYTVSSRSVLILLAILALFYVLSFRLNKKNLVVFCLLIAVGYTANYFFAEELGDNERFSRVLSLVDIANEIDLTLVLNGFYDYGNVDIRARLWTEASNLIDEKPFLGHGVVNPRVFADTSSVGMSSFHNSFYDLSVTYGYLGFVIFLGFYFSFFKALVMSTSVNKGLVHAVFWGFLVLSFVQPYLFNIQVASVFYFCLFVLCSRNKKVISIVP